MPRRAIRNPARPHLIWLVAVCLFAAGCLFVMGLILKEQGLDTAADAAQLISLAVALVPIAESTLSQLRRARRPHVVKPEDLAGAREHLGLMLLA